MKIEVELFIKGSTETFTLPAEETEDVDELDEYGQDRVRTG